MAALSCGSPPSREGLFSSRGGASGEGNLAGAGGSGGAATQPGAAAGAGGDVLLPSELGASGGQSGTGGSGGAGSDRDAGVLDATVADAAADKTGDAGVLGCLPADRANCDALVAALVHRYSFEGSGTSVVDSAGTANGTVVNGQLSGTGTVALSGSISTENYVNLPNGLISGLGSATIEAWLTWNGGDPWQRIFDFGSSQDGENQRGGGVNYLFLTPSTSGAVPTLRAAFQSTDTDGEVRVNSPAALPTGIEQHVAVVVNGQNDTLALFINGAPVDSAPLPSQLSAIDDINDWLGRSLYDGDPGLAGSISEFRIYGAALSAAQIALSFELGPEARVSR
jgi:hypothetical protein